MEGMDLNRLFGGVYAGRRVLVTGHTGFKGSWLTHWLVQMGAKVTGIALDPDTDPSHWKSLSLTDVNDLRIDLLDANSLDSAVRDCRPEMIFHLAAQALVRRSYRDPVSTFDVNVVGLVNLLESIRHCPSVRVVVNATTDKVYADNASATGYRETDPLGGHDPYSTSKACAELVSDSYRKCFFNADDGRGFSVRLATARAGNVIGGGDWAEDRLVPDLIRAGLSGHALNIRHPGATRPWQHVLDPLSGYLRLGQVLWNSERYAEAWNFGPGLAGEISVQELASRFREHWPSLHIQADKNHHPHEAAALRLNSDHAMKALAWRPVWDIDTAVRRSAGWYRTFNDVGQLQTIADLSAYISQAKDMEIAWAV